MTARYTPHALGHKHNTYIHIMQYTPILYMHTVHKYIDIYIHIPEMSDLSVDINAPSGKICISALNGSSIKHAISCILTNAQNVTAIVGTVNQPRLGISMSGREYMNSDKNRDR